MPRLTRFFRPASLGFYLALLLVTGCSLGNSSTGATGALQDFVASLLRSTLAAYLL